MSTYAVTTTNGGVISTGGVGERVSLTTVSGGVASSAIAVAVVAEALENTENLTAASGGTAMPVKDSRMVKLTKREVEVLTLVIEGNSSKEVADHLYVSKRTVDFHLANIYHKLGVTNRVQAFREATRRGLITFSLGASARQ